MPDYIPRPDGNFDAFAAVFKEQVHLFYVAHGLDENDLKDFDTAWGEWLVSYPAHVSAHAAAEGARQAKDDSRRALETAMRPIVGFIQAFPQTTDADRATLGITVKRRATGPRRRISTRPLLTVRAAQRLAHTLRLSDESTPTRRGKPRGASRAEVYVALRPPDQPAPNDPASYRYLGSVSDGEMKLSYPSSDGGRQAFYLARWMASGGEPGPWSETCSATVAA